MSRTEVADTPNQLLACDSESACDSRVNTPRSVRPDACSVRHSRLTIGRRQCGKTTFARTVGEALGYEYVTFDDDVVRAAAETDPAGFVLDLPERTILDEVQRVPK